MRKTLSLAALLAVTAVPALAQGQGRGGPPPADHWMTMDSLVQAVGVTEKQMPEVKKHYEALNAVMKKAVEERAAMRQQMQGGERPSADQMQMMRAKAEGLQADATKHYDAIRKLLDKDQQAKFDALPKPQPAGMGGGRRGQGQ